MPWLSQSDPKTLQELLVLVTHGSLEVLVLMSVKESAAAAEEINSMKPSYQRLNNLLLLLPF